MARRGEYTKLRGIGKGAFGIVHLCQNASGKQYVLKEITLKGLQMKQQRETMNEVAVLKKLKHPNIVAYHDSFSEAGTLCIVMEYASGGDLGSAIAKRKAARRPFSEPEVMKFAYQLTSALAYCHHELHLLHRDLKPQNVFLSADGDVKLGDFGLSKVLEATMGLAQTQCGTPLYMSPELCGGETYNRAADVWALGCVLYELMSLTAPWADVAARCPGGISQLLKRIRSSQLDLSSCRARYSPELCEMLVQLLARNGASRPSLNNVLLLDVMQRAAPPAAPRVAPTPALPARRDSDGGGGDGGGDGSPSRQLPPSWRKVPSQSRPGAFAYLHEPSGFRQAAFPDGGAPSAELLALARAGGEQPPPTAGAANAAAADEQRRLPHTWRRVPSQSRPGEFTYLHVRTGFRQSAFPLSDEPDPTLLADARQKVAQRGGGPPATADLRAGAAHVPAEKRPHAAAALLQRSFRRRAEAQLPPVVEGSNENGGAACRRPSPPAAPGMFRRAGPSHPNQPAPLPLATPAGRGLGNVAGPLGAKGFAARNGVYPPQPGAGRPVSNQNRRPFAPVR